jgi:hypothetical protein
MRCVAALLLKRCDAFELVSVLFGVLGYFGKSQGRRLFEFSRHILWRESQNEWHGIIGAGAVSKAKQSVQFALLADKLKCRFGIVAFVVLVVSHGLGARSASPSLYIRESL